MTRQNDFKSQDKSLRRQMVVDTAIKVFHRKGYRSATLDDVAHDLGLTKPALYHYVSSKENLLSQIYIQALESFFSYIYEIPSLELSPTEKMRLFIRRHLKTVVIENLAMFSVFFSEENQLPQEDVQRIRGEKRKFNKVVEQIIQEGMDWGCFRRLNPKLMSYAIIGMCNWLYRWYDPETSLFSPDEIADQFVSLLEDGYVHPGDEGRPAGAGASGGLADGEYLERRRDLLDDLKEKSSQVASLIDELKMLM
ncbi:MAG: TetR/AcrR family transcriptional regulator [Proteobacteria bacterium]|nr:TetR/AcrR family transcriptional regulator [Pseudomonadota bacterium]